MANDIHTVPRTETVAFRLSESEKALLVSAQKARGFGTERGAENQYMRFLVLLDGLLVGDDEFAARVKSEQKEQTKIPFIPACHWDQLRQLVAEFAISAERSGLAAPAWASNAVAYMGSGEFSKEPPPPVCCKDPRVVFAGVLLLCDTCDAELTPRAAAAIYRWREQAANKARNGALAREYARQAAAMDAVTIIEDASMSLQMMRQWDGRKDIPEYWHRRFGKYHKDARYANVGARSLHAASDTADEVTPAPVVFAEPAEPTTPPSRRAQKLLDDCTTALIGEEQELVHCNAIHYSMVECRLPVDENHAHPGKDHVMLFARDVGVSWASNDGPLFYVDPNDPKKNGSQVNVTRDDQRNLTIWMDACDPEEPIKVKPAKAKKAKTEAPAEEWKRRYDKSGSGYSHIVAKAQGQKGKVLSCCGEELNTTIKPHKKAFSCGACNKIRDPVMVAAGKTKSG